MKLERNVFGVLDRSARSRYGDRPCIGFEGRTLTFGELRDRSVAVAAGLTAHGVKPGDRVAVMLGNGLEWPEVLFGLASMGAVCVPVNVLLVGPEITHVCKDSGASFLIMDQIGSASADAIDHPFTAVFTVDGATPPNGANVVAYQSMIDSGSSDFVPVGADLDDVFVLYYSSGTTGLPKGAEHTHGNVLWNSFGQIPGLGLSTSVRYAVVPSFSWAAGFHIIFLALIWIGGYSEIRRTGNATADDIVDMLVHNEVTHVMLVPSLLRGLIARPDLMDRLRAGSLEWVITGSEPVPLSVIDAVTQALPAVAVVQGYGLSEFPTVATVLAADEVAEHEGSAGRPLPHVDVAVRDDQGLIQHVGRGELLIRSVATMHGYHNRPAQTDEAFRDGWLNTGDLIELDDNGFVKIVGRTKDLIISGGLNVYPKEIEDVIDTLDDVVEVAVVGVPHEKFGETAVAVVVTTNPAFDIAEVHSLCASELASYKRPREVLLRSDPLPRNANAKLLKRELRPWAAAQLDVATVPQ